MSERPTVEPRDADPFFTRITTRWLDNDLYGHTSIVVCHSFFDAAVNSHLIDRGALDVHRGDAIGLVVETHCNFLSPMRTDHA